MVKGEEWSRLWSIAEDFETLGGTIEHKTNDMRLGVNVQPAEVMTFLDQAESMIEQMKAIIRFKSNDGQPVVTT